MTPDLQRLRELLAAGTAGPWRFEDPSVEDCEIASGVERVMAGSYTEGGSINKPVKQADIDLIVAMHEALPRLLAIAEAADTLTERLRAVEEEAEALKFDVLAYMRAANAEAEQAAPEGWTLVPRVPVTGPRYEAGEWSRRNWEAALDDLAAAPAPQGE